MKKISKKPSKFIKALKIGGTALVTAGLVATTITMGVLYNSAIMENDNLSGNLASVNAELQNTLTNLDSTTTNVEKLNETLNQYNLKLENFSEEALVKDAIIKDYELILEEIKIEEEQTAAEVIVEEASFKEDKLSLDYSGTLSLDDNDLEKLGDYEIDFDGEDINVEETLIISGAFASNDKDFKGETLYKLEDGDIEYKVSFDVDMSTLDYTEDSAEFSFLGNNIEVIDWGTDYIKVEQKTNIDIKQGEEKSGVKVLKIGENSVLLSVDDETEVLKDDEKYDFGDLEVEVKGIFYDENTPETSIVMLNVGEDLDEKFEDGDEYDANEDYKWSITSDSVGLVLAEDFDEDDTALAEGYLFNFPNNYVAFEFELSEEDMNSVEIEFESVNEINFKGDFEDAEGDVVFNGTDFIDDDDEVFSSLELKDSDYKIEFNGTDFIVGDISFSKDIDSLIVNGEDFTNSDDNVKSTIGIEVKAPEDDLEEGELNFEVPEETIEATIIVR